MHRGLALVPILCSIVVGGFEEVPGPSRRRPAYDYVEGQVGKEFMTRLRAAVLAASK